jgi:hypothetical protein
MSNGEVRAALIVGPLGSGKTAVAVELGDILGGRGVPNAVIDLDWLGWANALGPERSIDELIIGNLVAVSAYYFAADIRHLVLTRAIGSQAQVEAIRAALPGVDLKVVGVEVSPETAAARLRQRDSGSELAHNLEESARFTDVTKDLNVDHSIRNEDRTIEEVAAELLELLGWL